MSWPARHAECRQVDFHPRDCRPARLKLPIIRLPRWRRIWAWCVSTITTGFVVADIPGLIEGAADGAGRTIVFSKHLARTGVLLRLVDLAPFDESVDPVHEAQAIVEELRK